MEEEREGEIKRIQIRDRDWVLCVQLKPQSPPTPSGLPPSTIANVHLTPQAVDLPASWERDLLPPEQPNEILTPQTPICWAHSKPSNHVFCPALSVLHLPVDTSTYNIRPALLSPGHSFASPLEGLLPTGTCSPRGLFLPGI